MKRCVKLLFLVGAAILAYVYFSQPIHFIASSEVERVAVVCYGKVEQTVSPEDQDLIIAELNKIGVYYPDFRFWRGLFAGNTIDIKIAIKFHTGKVVYIGFSPGSQGLTVKQDDRKLSYCLVGKMHKQKIKEIIAPYAATMLP